MPELTPFRALRYAPGAGTAAGLLAPPYDVIDPSMAEELRARGPHNCVRLVLPEGGEERYAAAAHQLDAWRRQGVLEDEAEPAAYLYRQRFRHAGEPRERLAVLAALRLSEFGEGEVLPHEETHSAPREDRLRLTLACRAQLSPVLLVARDADAGLREALSAGAAAAERGNIGDPLLAGETPDGMRHGLWRLDAGAARRACAAAGASPLLIADGHHRYETALEVRRRLPEVPGAEYVLACVVSAGDEGLLLLPTHRVLAGPPPAEGWDGALRAVFDLVEVGSREAAEAAARAGEAWMAAVVPGRGAWLLAPRERGAEGEAARDGSADARPDDPLARVAAAVFDRRVLRPLFGLGSDAVAREGRLTYHRDPAEAARAAGEGGAAFLLPPVELASVWRAAEAGRRLPPKTTYFYPKVPSGLLFRPLQGDGAR